MFPKSVHAIKFDQLTAQKIYIYYVITLFLICNRKPDSINENYANNYKFYT